MPLRIQQYKQTPIAMAPDELSKCINKYTEHHSFVSNIVNDESVNLIHFHNRDLPTMKPKILQAHSEPHRVNLAFTGKKLVLAQYHMFLPEYKNFIPVRNVIDFETPQYVYKKINKIRIGYSPSITKPMGEFYDKGYEETISILNNLKNKYNIEYDIITGVSLDECIKRKSECSIIIDDCKSKANSYHRSGLEGLALGKLTITSISSNLESYFISKFGSMPFYNSRIESLELNIENIIKNGIDYIIETGLKNRNWMFENWHPKTIVNEYMEIYKSILR